MGCPPRCFLSACETSRDVLLGVSYLPARRHGTSSSVSCTSSSVFPICLQDVMARPPRCFLSACKTSWRVLLGVSYLLARRHGASSSVFPTWQQEGEAKLKKMNASGCLNPFARLFCESIALAARSLWQKKG